MQDNPYHTYLAYRDNNAWTSERGAGKFLDQLFKEQSWGKGDHGCVVNGFKVTQNTSGADFFVTINSADSTNGKSDGHCLINYTDYAYLGWQEADYNLEIDGASQSLNRISYVVAYVDRDITYVESDKIVESPSVLKFAEVKGSEASSPNAPTKTQIQNVVGVNNPYIILAEIRINANASAITNSMITDRRKKASFSPDFTLDPDDSWTTGFYDAGDSTKTRIVVTGPNASTPAAIPGVRLIWLRKKA